MEDENFEISWQAPEYEHHEKDIDWLWTVGFVGVLVAIVAFYFGNWSFGILAVMASATLIIFGMRPPEVLTITLNERGIKVKDQFFPIEKIKSFWVRNDGRDRELSIETDRFYFSYIVLHFGNMEPEKVRELLLKKVQEKFHKKTLGDTLFERIGF